MSNSRFGKIRVHQVESIEDRIRLIGQQVDQSQRDPFVRHVALEIVRGLPQHGPESEDAEVIQVFNFVKSNIEYRQDPRDYDYYATAKRTLEMRAGDCFTYDTRVIVRSKASGCYEVRSLSELRNTWMAYDALSYDFDARVWVFKPVVGFHEKGIREVWEGHLDNGPSFRFTPDHQVWWLDGQDRSKRLATRALGEALDEARGYFKRVVVARQIPALGAGDLTQHQAYLAGIYAAEGHQESGRGRKLTISQDKPEILQRIKEALAGVEGASYRDAGRDHHNYLHVHAGALKDWLGRGGSNSFDMRFTPEVLGGSELVLRSVLEAHGDGDAYRPKPGSIWHEKVKAIHATSSSGLANELQLLSMILGEAWHTQLQMDHGGCGSSPIYRFHRWKDDRQPARRIVPEYAGLGYSNLRSMAPVGEEAVCCLSVEDTHNFVLSNGMVVHNCDDHATLVAGLLHNLGFSTGAKVISPDSVNWHIYPIVGVNTRSAPTSVIPLDTTQPESFPGWEPGGMYRRREIIATFSGGKTHIKGIR